MHLHTTSMHNNVRILLFIGALVCVGCSKYTSLSMQVNPTFRDATKENSPHSATTSKENLLLEAVERQDLGLVKDLINQEVALEVTNESDDTPLMIAAQQGNVSMATLLIANGAKINTADEYGDNPLLIAVWEGHQKFVKFLIDNGANTEVKDEFGNTPLMLAEIQLFYCTDKDKKGNWEAIIHLLSKEAEEGA